MKNKVIKAVLMLTFAACTAGVFAQKRTTPAEYIDMYKDLAIEHQDMYGIPASIKLAQGLLESDCGNSRLALNANNHFGIKCKNDWTGSTILHDDDAKNECFRSYSCAEDSYKDHSRFLDKSDRYQSLFDLDVTDYKGWAYGLKASGYATNPRYADLLIKIIEDHQLYQFDTEEYARADKGKAEGVKNNIKIEQSRVEDAVFTAAEKIDVDNYVVSVRTISGYPVYYNNGSEFVIAKQGDTYAKLSGITGISEKKLRKFNDDPSSVSPKQGEQVYIRTKGNKAANGKLIHIVKPGETMHSISQVYGIKLQRLANINRRQTDSVLTPGQQIRLM